MDGASFIFAFDSQSIGDEKWKNLVTPISKIAQCHLAICVCGQDME